jgi:calcineurin-like phosphoesterase family protein
MNELKITEKDKLFFTSDTHWGHENILRYCNRPFKNVQEMNQALIDNWNSVVNKDDIVIHCGDFAWGDPRDYNNIIAQLHGTIILIKGNHDRIQFNGNWKDFRLYEGYLNLSIADEDSESKRQLVTACHFPMLSWYQSHRGAWHVYGHWHNRAVNDYEPTGNEISDYVKEEYFYARYARPTSYDVGVDGNGYTPLSYKQVKTIINQQINELQSKSR